MTRRIGDGYGNDVKAAKEKAPRALTVLTDKRPQCGRMRNTGI